MRTLIVTVAGLCVAVPPTWAAAADTPASRVFAIDSLSIVVMNALDASGKTLALGSGVVIAEGVVISNCHVFSDAKTQSASASYRNKRFPATLQYADTERDLCSFTVNGVGAPPVKMRNAATLKVGEDAYAIGAPEGYVLTLSSGIISGLRELPGGSVIQMTTPISPGSSGGGLFDSEGRLIGITSYYAAKGQQLNFALPVEWINALPRRGLVSKKITSDTSSPALERRQASDIDGAIEAITAGDYANALLLLRPLAAQGDTHAKTWLAVLYAEGKGVRQDYRQAIELLGQAANGGNATAVTGLGLLYEDGHGFPKDPVTAYALYNLSAAMDSRPANPSPSRRTKLAGTMTAVQIEAGQQMTREMQESGVLEALGLARPSADAGTRVWNRYLVRIVQNNMQGMTAEEPYVYLVDAPTVDDAKRDRQLKDIQDVVARGVVRGYLLAFVGPNSRVTADLVATAFKDGRAGSFNGAIILFVGEPIDANRVQHAIAKTGATFRFVEMK